MASDSKRDDIASPSRKSASSPTPGIRRALTVDESAQLRRRPPQNRFSTFESPNPNEFNSPSPFASRRRSSTFSDLSLSEARKSFASSTDDILLPRGGKDVPGNEETSGWHSLPLLLALAPAFGGMIFQNGAAVITDIMILGLAAILLNWCVRSPWDWYHAAQSLRTKQEENNDESIILDDSEPDELSPPPEHLSTVPEDASPAPATPKKPSKLRNRASESATNELYTHELLALLTCFVAPVLGAYLLHSIRGSLSRPSEGLVSNYNLTIFLLASEMRPLSHLVKLVQARTLHLQRVVAANPYTADPKPTSSQAFDSDDLKVIMKRVEDLEVGLKGSSTAEGSDSLGVSSKSAVAEVRKTLQPELDALNRAVRRYEKRATLQTMQTEARLRELETRVGDAVSLAAAASRQRSGAGNYGMGSLVEWFVLWPVQAAGAVMSLPFKMVGAVIEVGKRAIVGNSSGRRPPTDPNRSAKTQGKGRQGEYRMGGERVMKR